MTKNIVETTGSFMFIDPYTGDEIPAHRPAVARYSAFLETKIGRGELKLLQSELPDEALDADFLEFWKEAPDMAVDAFVSSFEEPEPEPKKKAPAKKTEA